MIKKQLIQQTWKWGLSLLFGVAVLLFWGMAYRGHISYQEQYQLFLYDADYWWERVSVPGGVADYIAEFLTQFYYHIWAGAAIIALFFVVLQRLVWRLMRAMDTASFFYPLSFVPVSVLWFFMGDENALLSFPVALLLALLSSCSYMNMSANRQRIIAALVGLPLLYWVAGSVHFILMGVIICYEFRRMFANRNAWSGLVVSVVIGLYGLLCPLLAGFWLQYPLYRLMGGINYYRFPSIIPVSVIVLIVMLALLPAWVVLLRLPRKHKALYAVLMASVLIIGGVQLVKSGCNIAKDEPLVYDHLARYKQWNTIISKAEKKTPMSPFGVVCLNLSLGMTGQMADRMFQFYQNGVQGLLPEFQRDFILPLPTSEAYYHLGMINTAQRFTFEAMEAIPNFRKSTRCYKRLAETNLINGQYEVAAKYLHALQKTQFYKKWADDALTYLYDEEKINNHPEWGRLRKLRYTEDFLFSSQEMDMMLGLLYEQNRQNRMAFEYLLAYVMLQGDLGRFMSFYPLGKDVGYTHIPRSYQEALIYVWTQSHNNFKDLPWSISPQVIQQIVEFIRLYTGNNVGLQELLRTRFGGTYWYYLYNLSLKQS